MKINTLEKVADALQVSVFAFFAYGEPGNLEKDDLVWQCAAILLRQNESGQRKALNILTEMFKRD